MRAGEVGVCGIKRAIEGGDERVVNIAIESINRVSSLSGRWSLDMGDFFLFSLLQHSQFYKKMHFAIFPQKKYDFFFFFY